MVACLAVIAAYIINAYYTDIKSNIRINVKTLVLDIIPYELAVCLVLIISFLIS